MIALGLTTGSTEGWDTLTTVVGIVVATAFGGGGFLVGDGTDAEGRIRARPLGDFFGLGSFLFGTFGSIGSFGMAGCFGSFGASGTTFPTIGIRFGSSASSF
jgi:hypothetical protein